MYMLGFKELTGTIFYHNNNNKKKNTTLTYLNRKKSQIPIMLSYLNS
jgi:hypothetical protein